MPVILEQTAANSVRKLGSGSTGSASCRVTLGQSTKPGSLVIIAMLATGGDPTTWNLDLSGFTLLKSSGNRDCQLIVWYRENCPAISQATVSTGANRAVQARILEYSGVAQANALDKFVWGSGENTYMSTSSTGTLAASGELAVGFVGNQYANTSQVAFSGGLSKLVETTSPTTNQEDWETGRISFHHALRTNTSSFSFSGWLSTYRRHHIFLAVFKTGASGPARMSSQLPANTRVLRYDGSAFLSVFGQLKAVDPTKQRMLEEITSQRARIGPFNYQYRLGGWQGLLIGQGTEYRIESIEGLEGWEVRQSDQEIPRGDGALRGIDLQTARQVSFKLNFDGAHDSTVLEEKLDALYRTLVYQREDDWELIYRHPGRPLRFIRCRPIELIREMNLEQLIAHNQSFTLRAADPRHYAVEERLVNMPTSTSNSVTIQTPVINAGNSFAYPEIVVDVAASSAALTRLQLVNQTNGVTFDYRANIPARSQLIADMYARITGAPESAITIDGTSKYGGWQLPRNPFSINPGLNQVYLLVEPSYAVVTCTLRYRDTWSG